MLTNIQKIINKMLRETEGFDGRLGYRLMKIKDHKIIEIDEHGDYIVKFSYTINGLPFDMKIRGNCFMNKCKYQCYHLKSAYMIMDKEECDKCAKFIAFKVMKAMQRYTKITRKKELACVYG